MGGLIATAHLLDHQQDYVGAVLSGPAVKPAVPPSATTRIIGRLLSRLAPQAGILQLDSSAVSRDPDVVAAYRADPLVHTGKMSARLAAEMLDTMAMVQDSAKRITLPLLIVHGSEDSLASPSGAREMFGKLASADKTFQEFPGLYHEVFNEPERNEVLDLVSGWIAKHLN
jgi:alpha-beta hydrolase superfamily lysophospholipase